MNSEDSYVAELKQQFRQRMMDSLPRIVDQMSPEAIIEALRAPDLSSFLVAIVTGLPVDAK